MSRIAIWLCTTAVTLLSYSSLFSAPVAVQFVEGSAHGFLLLRSLNGDTLGYGEQIQVQRNGGIESRLVFHFKDRSIHHETVFFKQHKVFSLEQYRLVQRGPAFPKPVDVFFGRTTGQYTVKHGNENKRPKEIDEGRLDLPPDVYSGMLSVVLKNLAKEASETIHIVAFTPKPTIIEFELSAGGEHSFLLGGLQKKATHYLVKPKLGLLAPVASLLGKHPPDFHYWLSKGEVPTFLAFEGPFYLNGPIWRVELAAPQFAKGSG